MSGQWKTTETETNDRHIMKNSDIFNKSPPIEQIGFNICAREWTAKRRPYGSAHDVRLLLLTSYYNTIHITTQITILYCHNVNVHPYLIQTRIVFYK